jgi:lipopolysaccharide export system permease protein
MRIYSRYVFRQAASSFLLILSSLSGVVWIALALRQLNVVTSQGQDAFMLIKMTTLALPNLMAIIAPFSLLIACLHTLNRLSSDSELIVVTASGQDVWVTARPLLLLGALLSLALAFVAHVLQPWSMRQLNAFMVQVRTDLLTQVIQPGRFSSPENGLMFHIRERSWNGELGGLVMHDTRDTTQAQSYLAERGTIVKQDEAAFLVMTTGHILRRTDANEPPQIIAFDKYAIDLTRFEPQSAADGELRPRERYLGELLNPGDSKLYKSQPGRFMAELHERFSVPLYPIAFVFIVVAMVAQARSTRTGQMQSLVLAFVLAAGCRLVGLAMNNVIAGKSAFAFALYAIPLSAILISLVIIFGFRRQPNHARFADKLAEIAGSSWQRLTDAVPNLRRRPAAP